MEKIYYLNEKNEIVDQEHATHGYIQYYDDNGVLINDKPFIVPNPNISDDEYEKMFLETIASLSQDESMIEKK